MTKEFELSYRRLLSIDNGYKRALKFKTTEDIEGSDQLVGQESAERAMKFGISIKEKGYNIYISGESGSSKTRYAKMILKEAAKYCRPADDWCYVYNFDNKYEPVALRFKNGYGKMFKEDMEHLLKDAVKKIPDVFESEEYERQKALILEGYNKIKSQLVEKLNEIAESNNLSFRVTSTGFAFVPLKGGKPVNEREYDDMDISEKEKILKNISEVRTKSIDILKKLKTLERKTDENVKKLDSDIGRYIIENITANFTGKYNSDEEILNYIESVKKDMLDNLSVFINSEDGSSSDKDASELFLKYGINLIVDNSDTKCAPVIFEANPTYNNLIGSIEYESRSGTLATNFMMIRPGSILKANGGYLIIEVEDLLNNYQALSGVKRVLNTGEIAIEGLRSQLDLITITTMKPQPIPVDVKIILIGSEYLYQLLYEYGNDFKNLFKIKVAFDTEMEKNETNIYKVAQFISNYCSQNKKKHLENGAVTAVIDYSSRIAGSSRKISTCFEKIVDIINEADIWASISKNRYIRNSDIKKAVEEKNKRDSLIEEKMLSQYSDKKIIIDINGKAVGQVNGLSVIEIGGYSFGKPYRITASTYTGKSGIINIEREVKMSGNIHNKGVMIISGYIGSEYARNIPLSLTAHICFEQLYGFIDGDSASVAELYAILSSISRIPLKQSIAVTGSLNQMGQVQPVGGINEKIEGFYKVCLMEGLNGNQGVIIPYQNIDDIILDDRVLNDIKNGLFHIYAIKDVKDGIEIMAGVPAGERRSSGEFERGTFNFYVDKGLRDFIRNFNSPDL
ncbi:MAG TPA: ATP-dependent protease [Clostridiaceae bacterium]|nr:ATP-dependent protease [Clostridiaceae bacterium]